MTHTSLPYSTLMDTLWPTAGRSNAVVRGAALAMVGSLFLALSAKIQFPLYPVPMTLGTLAILTLGMAYGWRLAGVTLMLYMVEGAIGLPVFAGTPEKGIGLAYMMGSTGGYLLGYTLAAMAVGWLAQQGWDRTLLGTALAILIGNAIIYVPGLLWLGAMFGWDKPIFEWGFTPFILGDVIKLGLSMLILPLTWHLLGKRSHHAITQNKTGHFYEQ